MICFRDMTFCASDCTNTLCRRNFGPDDAFEARQWWGSDDYPVAWSAAFKVDCPDYLAPEDTAP